MNHVLFTEFAEKYHHEKFIKVKDAIQGLILKIYDYDNNIYKVHPIIPETIIEEQNSAKLARIQNFQENCPFELPNMYKTVRISQLIDYDGTLEEALKHLDEVKNLLNQYSSSNKAIIVVDC